MNDEDAREPADPGGSEPALGSEDASGTDRPSADDVDVQFASIIAHWDEQAPEPLGDGRPVVAETDWPDALAGSRVIGRSNADPDDASAVDGEGDGDRDAGGEQRLFGWRGHTPPPDDEHFEPPAPVLPPVHDATYWLAVAGMTLGPLLIVWAAVLSHDPDPGWWVLGGILLTVAGFGLMVLRGSGERDPDDNGAQV